MKRMSLVLCAAITGIFGSVHPKVAQAAELRILTSVALTSVLDELAPMFEKVTGTKLSIDYNLIAAQRKRILEGESADVIILSRGVMDELQKQDKIGASGLVNVAGTPDRWRLVRERQRQISARPTRSSRHFLTLDLLSMRIPQEVARAVSISHVSSIVSG